MKAIRELASGPSLAPGVGRVLGRVRGAQPGPTLVALGGLHGNEPAGVVALRRLLETLRGGEHPIRGELVALAGNRAALARGRRFLERDLNRAWTRRRIRALRRRTGAEDWYAEDREQLELLEALEAIDREARGPIFVLDLHTTSAMSGPWASVEDTLRNRAFALEFPVPVVLGLEERLEGTLMEHASRAGWVSLLFESGQHDDPRSVARTEAAIWIALAAAGVLVDPGADVVRKSRRLLSAETEGLPTVLEIRYRHPVRPADAFRMHSGFVNLQPIREGQVLASDRRGEIRSPDSGRVLMPLYQEQGEDGFFVVREFSPLWLRISAGLRRVGADRFVHWLPGIRRSADDSEILLVNRRVARWFAMDLLHLLGYRRVRERDRKLVVRRRPEGPGTGS